MRRLFGPTPPGLFTLLAAEIPDLFGRFGIMALLALYMTRTLHYSDKVAFLTYSTFLMLSYLMPLLGGYLVDRYLSYPKGIVLGGSIMFIGNCLMIVPEIYYLYIGLSLVTLGIGFFSPSLAAILDHLYKDNLEQRDGGFVLYYIAKNIGALLGPVLCGVLGEWLGYNYAFGLTAFAILVGVLVFLAGRHLFVFTKFEYPVTKSPWNYWLTKRPVLSNSFFVLLLMPLVVMVFITHTEGWIVLAGIVGLTLLAINWFKASDHQQRINLVLIGLSTLFPMIFFMLLAQCGTTFSLFIERLVDRNIGGVNVSAAVFYSLDPVFMLLLGPLVILVLKKISHKNYDVIAFFKYAIAMFIFAAGILVFVYASGRSHEIGLVSSGYVVLCYLIIPVAELCIMPVAISLVTRLAPANKAAQMFGVYSFGLAIGSYLNGIFSSKADVSFSVTSLVGKQHAALIYQQVFIDAFYILIGMGVLALVCYFLVKHWLMREAVCKQ